MIDTCKILIVDDRPDKLLSLEAVLDDLGPQIIRAESGHEALRQLLKHEFAVILLDVNMPGMDGFETAQFIRQRPNSAGVPIIFLTAMGDDMHVSAATRWARWITFSRRLCRKCCDPKLRSSSTCSAKPSRCALQADRLRRAGQPASPVDHGVDGDQLGADGGEDHSGRDGDGTADHRRTRGRYAGGAGAVFVQGIKFASYSPKHSKWRGVISRLDDPALSAMLAGAGKPIRMTQDELETQVPAALTGIDHAVPRRGLLAAPLIGHDGAKSRR